MKNNKYLGYMLMGLMFRLIAIETGILLPEGIARWILRTILVFASWGLFGYGWYKL